MKPHYDYLDRAKGFGIVLVIFQGRPLHIETEGVDEDIDDAESGQDILDENGHVVLVGYLYFICYFHSAFLTGQDF